LRATYTSGADLRALRAQPRRLDPHGRGQARCSAVITNSGELAQLRSLELVEGDDIRQLRSCIKRKSAHAPKFGSFIWF
jgi:hypothetical protein